MDPHIRELLDLVFRWVHVIAGIMWVGNSMLFNWLDRNLRLPANAKAGLEGEIWLVHSGAYYQIEKKQLEPQQLPDVLHWFKWQSYTTWISGFLLLVVVYYLGGGAFLVDPGVSAITPGQATWLGIALLVGGWLVYDSLWRSPLGKLKLFPVLVSVAMLVGVAYALSQVLSARAAFLHVGALLGTLMAGNVFRRIVPSQKNQMAATKSGQKPDPRLGYNAKQRSIHNNYMTFPLLFIMVSNHFPVTYQNGQNWLVLMVLVLTGAGIRHVMNIRFHFKAWIPVLTAIALVGSGALYALTRPSAPSAPSLVPAHEPVAFSQVQAIVRERCATCHAAHPTDPTFTLAPAGVMFDSPAQMQNLAQRIQARAVNNSSMPLGNKTGMTEEERRILGRWVEQGAPIE